MSALIEKSESGIRWRGLLFIVGISFLARIIPLLNSPPWTDLYGQQALPILRHLNIYQAAPGIFPYSPVSMFIPAICALISICFGVPFHLVIRLLAIAADVGIAAVLYWMLSKNKREEGCRWALFYALNPVSILIVSFHGNIISVAALFSLLAYTVLDSETNRNDRLSALLLGIAIGFRGYPLMLLPLFLICLKRTVAQKINYFFYATIPTALAFVPFLAADKASILREVFSYSGFTDYGFIAIRRALYSCEHHFLAYGLPGDSGAQWLNISKIMFLVAYGVVLFLARKRRLIDAIPVVFLLFYFFYGGVSSQYLIWVLPFAILRKDRFSRYYVALATWALLNFYWLYHPYILFGKAKPWEAPFSLLIRGNILSLSLFWLFCLFWAFMIVIQEKTDSSDSPV